MQLKIAARNSELARIQAYMVGEALMKQNPNLKIEFKFRESLGDKNLNDPLWKIPEKGVFTEDFYSDLIENRVDLVVHSWKDLPLEQKSETEIGATLARADARDILLFKRSFVGQKKLSIFSSSPRREYHLSRFLAEALPQHPEGLEIRFEPIRGNVLTRIKKWLAASETAGFIVAKAALDRMLARTDAEFSQSVCFLQEVLAKENWMILPLQECPNAAAQGALAIEVLKSRQDLRELLNPINCSETFNNVSREREILAKYGGGCHQKIGVSVSTKSFGQIEITKGQTSNGTVLNSKILKRKNKIPVGLKKNLSSQFDSERRPLPFTLPDDVNALWISRADGAENQLANFKGVVWTSGIATWKKLAAQGYWVHGSAESLGESEDPKLELLWNSKLKWARFTHSQAPFGDSMFNIDSYSLNLTVHTLDLKQGNFYYWKSFSAAKAAIQRHPEIKDAFHACGAGRTLQSLGNFIGGQDRIFVFLCEEDWLNQQHEENL